MAEQHLDGTDAVLRELQYLSAAHHRDVFKEFQAWHARLDALLSQQQSRIADLSWGLEGTNPIGHNQVEGFYGAMDGMQDDRLESAHDYGMGQLHDRLDALEQTPQPGARTYGLTDDDLEAVWRDAARNVAQRGGGATAEHGFTLGQSRDQGMSY